MRINLANANVCLPRSQLVVCRLAVVILLLIVLVPEVLAQSGDLVKRLEHVAALIADNRTTDAEQELSGVLRRAPNEPAALNLLGTIRAKQGKLREAELVFFRAVRADNQFVAAHMNLAYLYTLMGQPTKAISELKEVVRLDPKNTEAVEKLARFLLAQGQIDEGIKVLEQASQLQQLSPPLLLLAGDAYLKVGNAARAEESYQSVLSQESESTEAVLGLAQVAQFRGDTNTVSLYLARA